MQLTRPGSRDFPGSIPAPQAAGSFGVIPREILLIILAQIMAGPPDVSWKGFRAFTLCCKKCAGSPNERLYCASQIVERTNEFILRLHSYYHRIIHHGKGLSGRTKSLGFERICLAIERLVQKSSGRGLPTVSFRGLTANLITPTVQRVLVLAQHFPAPNRLAKIDLSNSSFSYIHLMDLQAHLRTLAQLNPVEVKIKNCHLFITSENCATLGAALRDLRPWMSNSKPITAGLFSQGLMGSLFREMCIKTEADIHALKSYSHTTNVTSLIIEGAQQLALIKSWEGLKNIEKLKVTVSNDKLLPAYSVFFNSITLPNLHTACLSLNSEEMEESLTALRGSACQLTKLSIVDLSRDQVSFVRKIGPSVVTHAHFALLSTFSSLANLSLSCPDNEGIVRTVHSLAAAGLHSRLKRLKLRPTSALEDSSWNSSIFFPRLERLKIVGKVHKISDILLWVRFAPQLNSLYYQDSLAKDVKLDTLAYVKRVAVQPGRKKNRQERDESSERKHKRHTGQTRKEG